MRNPAVKSPSLDTGQLLLASVGALLVGVLYIALPTLVVYGPPWLLLALEAVFVVPPVILHLAGLRLPHQLARGSSYALLAVLTLALASSIWLLVNHLATLKPHEILVSGMLLWASNVLTFASWYWETDGDGPVVRHKKAHVAGDFQFPQQTGGNPTHWRPGFVDYVFLAFCSATALSPADTMPLTHRAKLLMMVEALLSMFVLLLLVARFVNVV
ncbi:MAG TPA: hypothetical protein VF812_10985 [Ktedonobacterales bacterium]